MNARIKQWINMINALSLRERILAQIIILSLIFLLFDALSLSLDSQYYNDVKQKTHLTEQKKLDLEQKIIDDRISLNTKKAQFTQQEQYFHDIKKAVVKNDGQIEERLNRLVPPSQMSNLLRNLLEVGELHIVSINNEPVKKISLNLSDKNQIDEVLLYGHTATIKLHGNYQQIYNYLLAIENTQWDIFWNSLQYNVISYPIAEVTLRVMTVSTDKHWIGS